MTTRFTTLTALMLTLTALTAACRQRPAQPEAPAPAEAAATVATQGEAPSPYEVDAFATPGHGKIVRMHALMHASIRIQYDGLEIEVDPVRQLGERSVDYTAFPKADIVLVTHEHGDHFDPEAIALLGRQATRIVTNQRCADMLTVPATVLHNGEQADLAEGIHLEAIPAYNTTPGREKFHPKGRDNGFVLTLDGLRIYIAGDTEDIPEMAALEDIDIALLPCNQPYTMTPDQLLRAAHMVRPRVLFPYHYGQTDVAGLPDALHGEGIDVRIRHYE